MKYDHKYTDFNEWIDVVTKYINTLDWYNTNKIEIITNNPEWTDNSLIKKYQHENSIYQPIDWNVFVDMLKKEYTKSGNVYSIFRKYGYMYNSNFGYMTLGERSNKHNRNAGCYPNGNLKLCWGSFISEGEWDNITEEGIGPLTKYDSKKLTDEIYPDGSYKD